MPDIDLETLVGGYRVLEAALLVLLGAGIKPLFSGLEERRKRKFAREDQERQDRRTEIQTKRANLAAIIDQLASFAVELDDRRRGHPFAEPFREVKAVESMAIMSGDPELVEAVANLKKKPLEYEVEFRALLARKVQELEEVPVVRRPWWRRLGGGQG